MKAGDTEFFDLLDAKGHPVQYELDLVKVTRKGTTTARAAVAYKRALARRAGARPHALGVRGQPGAAPLPLPSRRRPARAGPPPPGCADRLRPRAVPLRHGRGRGLPHPAQARPLGTASIHFSAHGAEADHRGRVARPRPDVHRRGPAGRARARPRGHRPRHGAPPARPRPRRAHEDRARHAPRSRPGVRHGRTLGGPIALQVANRDFANWGERMNPWPVEARRARGPPAAARPRRPGRAVEVRLHRRAQRPRARQRARDGRPRRRRRRVPRRSCARSGSRCARTSSQIGDGRAPSRRTSPLTPADFAGGRRRPGALPGPRGERGDGRPHQRPAQGQRVDRRGLRGRSPSGSCPASARTCSWEERLDGRLAGALCSIQAVKGVGIGEGFDLAGRPGSQAHDEIFYGEEQRLLPRDQPLGRPGGRHDDRRAARGPRRDEADPDADQAAALGRHRHARAGAGAARAHRLARSCRRPASWGRRWSPSCSPTPTARSSAATTSTTCARRSRAYRERIGWQARVEGRAPPDGRALVFVGFMGAGKTTAARELAARSGAGRRHRRAARASARRADRGFFAREGEAAFRAREEERGRRACSTRRRAAVVALGGGALGSERVRDGAAAPHRRAARRRRATRLGARRRQRAAARARPRARSRALLRRRAAPVYEAPADAIAAGATARAAPRRCPRSALRRARPPARGCCGRGRVGRATRSSSGAGCSAPPWPLPPAAALRRHRRARRRRATVALASRPRASRSRPGEAAQDAGHGRARAGATLAAEGMTPRRPRRRASAAASWATSPGSAPRPTSAACRSCRCPTTLVAQVDSAYGGKTGVDLPEAKNYVGAYHQPAAVLADPAALATLPPEERAAGYAEVLKTALIAGGRAVGARRGRRRGRRRRRHARLRADEARRRGRGRARRRPPPGAEPRPHRRPRDRDGDGLRPRYRHGEAVGLGLLAALRLSGRDDLRAQVAELLAAAGLPDALRRAPSTPTPWWRRPRATRSARARPRSPSSLVDAPGDGAARRPVARGRPAPPPWQSRGRLSRWARTTASRSSTA